MSKAPYSPHLSSASQVCGFASGFSFKARESIIRDRAEQIISSLKPSQTRVVARQIAAMLLHEFGEPPTVKRIRDLMGRGSFSTLTDELRIFWSTLQVSAAEDAFSLDMPAHIVQSHRAALSTLWRAAQDEARQRASPVCHECNNLRSRIFELENEPDKMCVIPDPGIPKIKKQAVA